MLSDLSVEGVGVIERAEISLGPGCTALTGETGAGKTLLVAALGLLLGGRADRTLLREGSPEARVEGRLLVPASHPVLEVLAGEGVLEESQKGPKEVVMARSLSADGRSKARINGRLVRVGLLDEIGPSLVEITGQRSSQQLAVPGVQRGLLDAFAGSEAQRLAAEVVGAVRAAGRAERAAADLRTGERERARELDLLRHEVEEIEAAGLQPGERERLAAEAERLEHAESIALRLARATQTLAGEGAAEDMLAAALTDVEEAARLDSELGSLSQRLQSVVYEVADVARELASVTVASDPAALEAVRERLAAIGRLRRKYGDDESDILDYLTTARRRAAELESEGSDAGRWERERHEHQDRANALAARLSALRHQAAPRLAHALEGLLAELALGGASVVVSLEPRSLYEGGTEHVEFLVSTNPGETPRPLTRIASGGELSRIALALALLTTTGPATTMVFDEVDAGIGGRAAQAVGRCLSRLARKAAVQVLVVTHLPQVAAFADDHYRVGKVERNGRTEARVERIEGEGRIGELSRMLAGLPESRRAKEHALELLEMASQGASRG